VNIALFDSRAEADGFSQLLADVAGVESVVAQGHEGFAVDVLRPADFIAGVVYVLYYVKGIALDDLSGRPVDERVELLRQHLVHYADGERRWDPPATGLRWYAGRAQLDDDQIAGAVTEAERDYRTGRRGLLSRLFRGKR